ncbi:universal stress protein [Photobacterium sp. ZSDE20]|uniref:Universal stress protein n=1 Tax=Photobacterium pectinilyticum TaxID=2906793 RepID=A0ABT1N7U8_9GAMM|nr:universal stress protein [Photobacterium sp. ZSDE20]MCQ1059319.1 universal stress protein [Photobacterium sp. ZSDE20]MDD1825578.1 universal stress protein [Photobacterium sp. ZSDE20]
MKLNRLLVTIAPEQPLNDSFHQAFGFANQCSAQVTLLAVIEELCELKEVAEHSDTAVNIIDEAKNFYHKQLNHHVEVLNAQYPNITFNTLVRIGIPHIEIIKEAKASQASMVVIDSTRDDKKLACQRGRNTLSIIRKSEVPIWSISSYSKPIDHVVAAIDLSNIEYQGFNTKLIELALEYCEITGADLTLCHAWRLDSEGYLRKWSGYDDNDIEQLSQKMKAERIERLKSLLAPHQNSVVNTKIEIVEGEAREVLPLYASAKGVDVVILGSLSRTGIAGFLMGNTAESMINQLSCSVLTLKPDSFKSPV